MAKTGIIGTINANDGSVSIDCQDSQAIGIEISGIWVGTLDVEATINGTTWFTPFAQSPIAGTGTTQFTPDGATANGRTIVFPAGAARVRVHSSAWTSGIATISMRGTSASGGGGSSGGGGGGGGAVTIADGADVTLGAKADAAAAADNSTATLMAFVKRLVTKFTTQFPAALGGTTSAASLPVVLSSDGPFATQTGSVTETAPATDIASSGLNGRLQRISQRLTSLIALLPGALVGGRLDVNIGAPATLPVSIAASADSAGGATTDAAVVSDTNGSRNAFLRGLVKIFADIWDSTLHFLHVRSGTYQDTISVTLTRSAITAYTANRLITNSDTTIRTITNAARVSGGTGEFEHLSIVFSDNWSVKPQLEIVFYDTTLTPQADNALPTPSDSELLTQIGIIPITAAYVIDATAGAGGNMTMDSGPISLPFKCVGSANLFFEVIVRNAATAGANSSTMTFRFKVRQN